MPADAHDEDDRALAHAAVELVRARDSVVLSMTALEREITRTFDWREWVRRKPGTALALAFGLGLLLGRRN